MLEFIMSRIGKFSKSLQYNFSKICIFKNSVDYTCREHASPLKQIVINTVIGVHKVSMSE